MRRSLEILRSKWEATAGRDMRSSGNRTAYHNAYTAYYHALGRALGLERNGAYYVTDDGRMPGCNEMETLLQQKRGA